MVPKVPYEKEMRTDGNEFSMNWRALTSKFVQKKHRTSEHQKNRNLYSE
jgi:hypothetical protein